MRDDGVDKAMRYAGASEKLEAKAHSAKGSPFRIFIDIGLVISRIATSAWPGPQELHYAE